MKRPWSAKTARADRNPFWPLHPERPTPVVVVALASSTLILSILVAGALAANMMLPGGLLPWLSRIGSALADWTVLLALLGIVVIGIAGARTRR